MSTQADIDKVKAAVAAAQQSNGWTKAAVDEAARLAALLTPCPVGPGPTPTPGLPNKLYGYYSSGEAIGAMGSHCNVSWLADWEMPAQAVPQARAAVAAGVPRLIIGIQYMVYQGSNYVGMPVMSAHLAGMLLDLRAAGVLDKVIGIYPVDEPDRRGISDATVRQANADIREVLGTYPELVHCKLAVIYGSQGRNTPGLSSYDWCGFDDYDSGPGIFTNGMYDQFAAKIAAPQRIILVAGGASPWRTAPDAFVAKALADPRVLMLCPFIWIDYPQPGIGSNGMAAQYVAAGKQVIAS